MSQTQPQAIDEKSLRGAIAHLSRWHAVGSLLSLAITFLPAYLIATILPRVEFVRSAVLNLIEVLPFVTEETARRRETILFVLGGMLLLILTNIGTGIASDIVRERIIDRVNRHPQPLALAEAMKNRLRARSGRLEQQYRFFPKFSNGEKLAPNGLFVGIGTMTPFWLLMVFFFIYFRW
ncbi:MAG: hypothetical protein MRY64_03880 [Hyphomonadaceae bacterium]|nr:hypothetical protein [Hyphomonadaceae bacterium]